MIRRDLDKAEQTQFDLAVVGGGIYGASVLRAAASRGLNACLIEAADFGGATSGNSLRILHGGLRYLQSLHLTRFFQSVRARREVARRFPRLVRPLPCLLPLYGEGLKRNSLLRAALAANDVLSFRRNVGVAAEARIPSGRVMSPDRVIAAFPGVRRAGLTGGAEWTDYLMHSSERILIESLREACAAGALALNYVEAEAVDTQGSQVIGIAARDVLGDRSLRIRSRCVVNCAGPYAPALARKWSSMPIGAYRGPSLAFNLLIDARLEGERAIGVSAPRSGAPVLFLVPAGKSVLAGTAHLPRPENVERTTPTEAEINAFLADVRDAVPGFKATPERVKRVFSGLLPASRPESSTLASREIVADHGRFGGPNGLYSVVGVKFTTANEVAERVISILSRRKSERARRVRRDSGLDLSAATGLLLDSQELWRGDVRSLRASLQTVAQEESVQQVDDLVLRRTNWSTTSADLDSIRARVAELAVVGSGTS